MQEQTEVPVKIENFNFIAIELDLWLLGQYIGIKFMRQLRLTCRVVLKAQLRSRSFAGKPPDWIVT